MKQLPRILFIIFLFITAKAQESKFIRLENADSLVGKTIGNEPVRILIGNVHLAQEDITIFCDKATQFMQSNRAELEGNVRVLQKNVTIRVPSGAYDGNSKRATGRNGIILNDGAVTLSALSGDYDFPSKTAFFRGNVKLSDDSSVVRSEELTYNSENEKSVAVRNVSIEQNKDIIYSDTLVNFRKIRYSIADGNVRIVSPFNNLIIYGNHLENSDNNKISFLTGNVLMIQLDSAEETIDTLIISCDSIVTQQLNTQNYFAYDSVKIWRSGFSSLSDIALFYRSDNKIISHKSKKSERPPVFWQDVNQIFGDSIIFYTENDKIKEADIFGEAFIISRDTVNPEKFNQLNGGFIKISFDNNEIKNVFVTGKALSIYYSYEDNEPNGLNKSSADSMVIYFDKRKVQRIKLIGSPEGEYHPEELIAGKEKEFILGGFKWYEKTFSKSDLLKKRNIKTE